MINPISTYRIQFNKDFTFRDFRNTVPYLHELGIKTIYASPIYKAVPGSTHGYDVTDPNEINPEIGTIAELRELSAELKALGMFWIQDIVPNHMGFHQDNNWLMDLLKNGEASKYRRYFDLTTEDLATEPLMVPFLGEDLQTVIANGDLELIDAEAGRCLKYFDSHWPLRTDTDDQISNISELARQQHYRLCSFEETNKKINYRRFFTVNSLICLNMQHQEVFSDYHRMTRSLLEEEIFQGLRIDHVDGLADPTAYLVQLRELCGPDVYIVVEKILEPGEQLPRNWPVQGTTGYDFLGLVNQLFTNQKAERKFDAFYKGLGSYKRPVHVQLLKKKRVFLENYMQGELDNLERLAVRLGLLGDIQHFRELVSELLVRLPVYRFYNTRYPLQEDESKTIETVLIELLQDEAKFSKDMDAFRDLLLGKNASRDSKDPAIIFFKRLMQFSGPLMAKGVEDTLMYTFNRFIGNNEVGDSPELFGISVVDFHDQMALRSRYWRLAMNASATHDTKRGEDARSRLAVLTDLRSEWLSEVEIWQEMNVEIKTGNAPDANDEYFIYQTLIATCPENGPGEENYEQRLLEYIEKALRESKRNSAWEDPDLQYESRTKDFIQYLLDPGRNFFPRFSRFLERVVAFGKQYSLSSLVLKHTLPGIPDTYQGTELWDLSMVDPDNRRPVDYQLREKILHQNQNNEKIRLLRDLLGMRKQHAELFFGGIYHPLEVRGKFAKNIIAFARNYKRDWILVATVVNLAALNETPQCQGLDWNDTEIVMPEALTGRGEIFKDVLDKASEANPPAEIGRTGTIAASAMFNEHPFAIWSASLPEQNRGAGILLPVSSLPSGYGIGDFGPAAEHFVSFLANSGMKYWQLLPMNPLSADQGYSPYSATSVMAGNTLLISPRDLADSDLLRQTDLERYQRKIKRKISYDEVAVLKNELLGKAFANFSAGDSSISHEEFKRFRARESSWLNDYALFVVISQLNNHKPWFQWPKKFKFRDAATLETLQRDHSIEIEEICWQQFIFFRQWKRIKYLANVQGIELIGDLPFYTAHNSADVWVSPKLFAVDAGGAVIGAAGVPPDYFNADGQLWGMPVYNWQTMAKGKYKWWVDRIRKNLEIYDRVRLDHFRAFSDYWEVPAGNETAKDGAWKPGPGSLFFKELRSALGNLPLIAEDLGDIGTEVYQLRDEFNLPGMKVLQFAFGDDIATSVHAPHNFTATNCVVYTGTHDNNTTRGWYEGEVDEHLKKRLAKYSGSKINGHDASWTLIRLALSSVAEIAVIPMQDLLNKSAKSRMNTPASASGNWAWRLKREELTPELMEQIRSSLQLYGR